MNDEEQISHSKGENASPGEKDWEEKPTPLKKNEAEIERKKESTQIDTLIRILLYIFSFFMGPFGLGVILGAIFFVQQDPEFRDVGRVCIILSIVPSLLIIALVFAFLSLGFLFSVSHFFF